jgi:methionyl-tRNA formyltransferase
VQNPRTAAACSDVLHLLGGHDVRCQRNRLPSLPAVRGLGMMQPSMARLAFFGTPEFALPALRALHAHHEVALVVCTPDAPAGRGLLPVPCPVKTEAVRLGLPLTESKLTTGVEIEALALALADLRLDAGIMVAFGPPIPERVLAIPTRGFIMAHASLLPRWRGAAPVERALEEGDTESGVSLVRLTTDRYAGDLYAVERLIVLENDDAISLTGKLADLAAAALTQHLDAIIAGERPAVPQRPIGISEARKIDPAELDLSWSWSARQIVKKARAFAGRGGLKLTLHGEAIQVFAPRRIEIDHEASPGSLLPSHAGELVFATRDRGTVAFAEAQRSGRRRISAAQLRQELQFRARIDPDARRRSDLVSAALRHARVAEHLVAEGPDRALDEGFHIAGFGPECAQAACLGEEWFGRAIGHGFDAAQAENLRLLLRLDPKARRYLPADWGARYPELRTWTVQSRYRPTGSFDLARATAVTIEAREIVRRVVASLWADGLLDEGALR